MGGGTAPVGREREFQALLDVAGDAQAGRGAVVFLAGATGSGKSALLREFAAELDARPRDARPDLELALCYETSAGIRSGRSARCCVRSPTASAAATARSACSRSSKRSRRRSSSSSP